MTPENFPPAIEANLFEANLFGADLTAANLEYCILTRAILQGSSLMNCRVYGISAWDLMISEETKQSNLVITPSDRDTFATVEIHSGFIVWC